MHWEAVNWLECILEPLFVCMHYAITMKETLQNPQRNYYRKSHFSILIGNLYEITRVIENHNNN